MYKIAAIVVGVEVRQWQGSLARESMVCAEVLKGEAGMGCWKDGGMGLFQAQRTPSEGLKKTGSMFGFRD